MSDVVPIATPDLASGSRGSTYRGDPDVGKCEEEESGSVADPTDEFE